LSSLLLKLKYNVSRICNSGHIREIQFHGTTRTPNLQIMTHSTVMTDTNQQYDKAIASCKDIFIQKTLDYGTSWRVLRTISIVDQLFIKAQRIRTIQQKGVQRVGDDVSSEFRGIVNYGVIGLIQLQFREIAIEDLAAEKVSVMFDQKIKIAKDVMEDKNHDYGEAWREMSQESFVDLILMKLMRIRQILSNDGKTTVSEGIDANFTDIINYAVFALILMEEGRHKR
jgi:Nucleotide modification associated domain 1